MMSDRFLLALSYRCDDRSADATAGAIEAATGSRPFVLRGDLSKEGLAEDQVRLINERYGRLDAIVHCAAIATFKPALQLQVRELRRTLSFSFESLHLAATAAASALQKRGGSIVAISSQGARSAIHHYAALGAAKAALESYVRHLAAEAASLGVRVNAVSPGLLVTGSLPRLGLTKGFREAVAEHTPIRRLVTCEEVAAVVRFLLSADASGINGQTIIVDGGYEILA